MAREIVAWRRDCATRGEVAILYCYALGKAQRVLAELMPFDDQPVIDTFNEVAGPDWLDPDWFRFGASTLLNDLLMQRTKLTTGRYSGPDYFTLD